MLAGARRLSRPSLSGLARLSRRQGRRDLYRRAARALLAGGARPLRASGSSSRSPPAIPRSPRSWQRRRASRCSRCGPMAARRAVPAAHRAALYPPRLEYRTAGARRGGAHWRKQSSKAPRQPKRAARSTTSGRLAPADPQRECRPVTFRALVNEFGGAAAAFRRCRFCRGAADAPTSASAPRRKPRPSSRRRSGSAPLSSPSVSPAIPLPAVDAPPPALRQGPARARRHPHRRHRRFPQRLGGGPEIHAPRDRSRVKVSSLPPAWPAASTRRRITPHSTRHHSGARRRHRQRLSAGERQVASGDRRAGLLLSERPPGFSPRGKISRAATA